MIYLSCGTQDFHCSTLDLLVVAYEVLLVACGIQFPDQEANPGTLNWEHAVLATGEAMAPHSSTLAWKILWMEEPGRLQPMGSLRVGYD